MRKVMAFWVMALAGTSTPLFAQAAGQVDAQRLTRELQAAAQLREARYQIGQMERLLEGAVEHGASVIRDRLSAVMPADMLLTENARARGFRLDGYGMFFDVEVPSLAGTLPWSIQTLDQNDLGLDSALRTLRSFIERSASNDVNLQQALKRVELQVAPVSTALAPLAGAPAVSAATAVNPPAAPNARPAAAPAAAAAPDPSAALAARDAILSDPNEAYRTQIREALIDTMLEHSRGLSIAPEELLTVAARGIEDRPRLTSADSDGRTHVLSLSGADLTAFLGGQITRDEARQRVQVRVF
ncbi:MAG TPA: hypothetical protein VH417_04465 [Vicinamibacterales bacterium]|jgi:hypothetical protein